MRALSISFCEKAANDGDAESQFNFATLLLAEGNKERAIAFLEKSANQKNGQAAYKLGEIYESQSNLEKATFYYEEGCKQSELKACERSRAEIENLERALATPANKEDESVKALFDGVELTLKELVATVARFGVEAVGVVGEAFNPDLHQAISMQPAEGFETNQISVVLQKGYTLNGRVIRPAMVMVAA
ncbi:TPA: nucleotide exchange factor GrpE [Haemophilus influenzae]